MNSNFGFRRMTWVECCAARDHIMTRWRGDGPYTMRCDPLSRCRWSSMLRSDTISCLFSGFYFEARLRRRFCQIICNRPAIIRCVLCARAPRVCSPRSVYNFYSFRIWINCEWSDKTISHLKWIECVPVSMSNDENKEERRKKEGNFAFAISFGSYVCPFRLFLLLLLLRPPFGVFQTYFLFKSFRWANKITITITIYSVSKTIFTVLIHGLWQNKWHPTAIHI